MIEKIKSLPVQTGDIFYRRSDAYYMCIPFSLLTAYLSKSRFSHASVVLIEDDEIFLIEVTYPDGTLKHTLKQWLNDCDTDRLMVQRLKDMDESFKQSLAKETMTFLEQDPPYDTTFKNPDAFYCNESVVEIYRRAGARIMTPDRIEDILEPWQYWIFWPINWTIKIIKGDGFDTNIPLYYVGNEERGMMASDKLETIFSC